MAVTVTAALVKTLTPDPARPPKHAGWNNPVGDPTWIEDIDWYRRVQLECKGPEVGSIVNWEIFDDTIPLKTTAEINLLANGASGPVINNKETWTVWAYTGVNVAGQAYKNTRTSLISTLRANNPRVQLLLGKKRASTGTTQVFTVFAFLPGSGRTPAGTATVTVQSPFSVGPGIVVTMDDADPSWVTFDLPAAPGETLWDFGDGTEPVRQNDAHTAHYYAAPGEYTVVATGGHGTTDTVVVTVQAPVGEPEVEAAEPEITVTPDPVPEPTP